LLYFASTMDKILLRYAQAVNRQLHSEMMIKWNIKLVTENKTDEMTTRHLLPTQMCFIFFSHHTKILKFYCHCTNGTFDFASSLKANASAKSKEPFFANALVCLHSRLTQLKYIFVRNTKQKYARYSNF